IATEPAYFDGLKRIAENRAVSVRIRAKGVSPVQLIEVAARYRDHDSIGFDEVWCVADVDEFDISGIGRLARDAGINLAISNPCFELWLLLHHEDCRSRLETYAEVHARLVRYVSGYDKSELNITDFARGITVAVTRGKALDPTGADHIRNPSTSVWRLVEII